MILSERSESKDPKNSRPECPAGKGSSAKGRCSFTVEQGIEPDLSELQLAEGSVEL
jgi:hypothetical protein